MGPIIENPKNLALPPHTSEILQIMFVDYGRVVIKKEFGGGLSGSRVFLVRPIRIQDEENRPELPVVVKLASISLIQKEWTAYHSYISNRLLGIAELRGEPVLLPDSTWGGLCYPLLGGGTFEVVSLNIYFHEASLTDIQFVLGRLMRIVEQMAQLSRPSPEFHLRSSYDPLLPVNLWVAPTSSPPETPLQSISPQNLSDTSLQPGDYVRVEGFAITKVDLQRQTVTLNLPPTVEGTTASYTLRLQGATSIAAAQTDHLMPSITGVVIKTRHSQLYDEAQAVLGPNHDLTAATLSLSDGDAVPNPLLNLAALLNESRDVKVGRVHGDMNLENILVDPAVRDINLIDFAEARRDHILHDFLRMETEVMTKLVPRILQQHHLKGREVIPKFYEQLHWLVFVDDSLTPHLPHPALEKPLVILTIIRQTARRYLLDFHDCTEYYQGLTLYMLGALKFRNLAEVPEAPLPKEVAFWVAATAKKLMRYCQQDELPPPLVAAIAATPAAIPTTSEPSDRRWGLLWLVLAGVAGVGLLLWGMFAFTASPTQPPSQPLAIAAEPSLMAPLPLPNTPTATPSPTPSPSPLPPTATPSPTPSPSPLPPTPPPTQTPMVLVVTATLPPATSTPSPTLAPPTATATTTPTLTPSLPSGSFRLLNPTLDNPTYGPTTFEWEWIGSIPPDYGFEIRVYKEGASPAGAHDAVLDNREGRIEVIGDNRYRLSLDISGAAGVQGCGDYLWAVLLVQIDPEYVDLGQQAAPTWLRFEGCGGGDSGGSNASGGGDGGGGGATTILK